MSGPEKEIRDTLGAMAVGSRTIRWLHQLTRCSLGQLWKTKLMVSREVVGLGERASFRHHHHHPKGPKFVSTS